MVGALQRTPAAVVFLEISGYAMHHDASPVVSLPSCPIDGSRELPPANRKHLQRSRPGNPLLQRRSRTRLPIAEASIAAIRALLDHLKR